MIIINQSPKVRSINEKLDRTDHSLDSLICFGKFHRKPFLALVDFELENRKFVLYESSSFAETTKNRNY